MIKTKTNIVEPCSHCHTGREYTTTKYIAKGKVEDISIYVNRYESFYKKRIKQQNIYKIELEPNNTPMYPNENELFKTKQEALKQLKHDVQSKTT